MPEELCQVSPKSHYVSLAQHSDPNPCVGICDIGVGVPVHESVGASEGKSYTGIKWIGSTLD